MTDTFLITCEHGGNSIPAPYQALFEGMEELLESHRGHDPGALVMAHDLTQAFDATLVFATVSRLIIDLNRTQNNPHAFSTMTRSLSAQQRAEIVAVHYRPYRQRVEDFVSAQVAAGQRVIHISSHSYTPNLDGTIRTADVGLLYDPARAPEVALCARWKTDLEALAPALRVRRNYPYLGKGDGMTSYLRHRYPTSQYVGVELEINQAIVLAAGQPWQLLRQQLIASLQTACADSLNQPCPA